jgi:ubiquinone/menaquinone biosynthesis C-methylase UbiE
MKSRSIYRDELKELSNLMNNVGATPFTNFVKIISLTTMNMRYETVAFNKNLKEHPFDITRDIIESAGNQFKVLMDISFIEDDDVSIQRYKSNKLEEKHEELWQEIWSRHNEKEFQEFIDLKAMRLEKNGLSKYIVGQECIDFGCGNGSFSFALLEKGAKYVTGIDFGKKSIKYAQAVSGKRGFSDNLDFKIDNVMSSSLESNKYGFAVSNGVFHHLGSVENMKKAIKEVSRVMKRGGWFWIYVDGNYAISMDLWDTTVDILKGVDVLYIENILKMMNVKRNKVVHIVDGSNATYLHSTFEEMMTILSDCGFTNFRRLSGCTETDFDLDVTESDSFGEEKFGTGDLRILCQKV